MLQAIKMEVQQETMKDPKKVEVGKRWAEYNHRKKEELAQPKSESKQVEPKLTYYGIGAMVAIGVLGILGYCIYQSKKTPKKTPVYQTNETPVH